MNIVYSAVPHFFVIAERARHIRERFVSSIETTAELPNYTGIHIV